MLPNEMISILSGGAAGLITDCILYPIDTIKTRQQSSRIISNSETYTRLFAGISTVIASSIPNAAVFFLTYELVKNHSDKTSLIYQSFLGAIAGEITSGIVRCPFERMKQKSQDQPKIPMRSLIKSVIITEGIRNGLFRGYLRMIMREVPFSAIQYPIWESMKSGLKNYRGYESSYDAALSGFFAGGISAFITTPLDVAKTKVMIAEAGSMFYSMSLISTIRHIYIDSGVRGLFRGTVPRVIQISFGGAIFLGIYDLTRKTLIKFSTSSKTNE